MKLSLEKTPQNARMLEKLAKVYGQPVSENIASLARNDRTPLLNHLYDRDFFTTVLYDADIDAERTIIAACNEHKKIMIDVRSMNVRQILARYLITPVKEFTDTTDRQVVLSNDPTLDYDIFITDSYKRASQLELHGKVLHLRHFSALPNSSSCKGTETTARKLLRMLVDSQYIVDSNPVLIGNIENVEDINSYFSLLNVSIHAIEHQLATAPFYRINNTIPINGDSIHELFENTSKSPRRRAEVQRLMNILKTAYKNITLVGPYFEMEADNIKVFPRVSEVNSARIKSGSIVIVGSTYLDKADFHRINKIHTSTDNWVMALTDDNELGYIDMLYN